MGGCQEVLLDKLSDVSSEDFCPGIKLEDGSCPSANGLEKVYWNFDNEIDYSFDSNYVELKNGKLSLKATDQVHSGLDFNNGTHLNTYYDSATSSLRTIDKYHTSLDVREILSDKSSSLVGYWRFENSPADSSGNGLNSSNFGGAYYSTNSKIGYHSLKHGSGVDGVIVSNMPHLTSFTISSWVYVNSNNIWSRLFAKGLSTSVYDWRIIETSNGEFRLESNGACSTSSFKIPLKSWNHLVITYGDGFVKIYLNNKKVINQACGAVPQNSASTMNIGADVNGWSAFDGNLDDFAIWSEVLSAIDIKKLFDTQKLTYGDLSSQWTPKWDNLIGYWKFDGNLDDSSPKKLNSTTYLGDHTIDFKSKVGSGAVKFDGTGARVRADSLVGNEINRDRGTISCWIYNQNDDFSSVTNRFALRMLYSTPEYDGLYFRFYDDDRFQFVFTGSGVTKGVTVTNFTKTIPLNSWTHVLGTWDSVGEQKIKLFINGVLYGETVQPNSFTNNFGYLDLGYGTAYAHKGALDDCAIWNTNLAASDVKEIYEHQKQKNTSVYTSPILNIGTSINWDGLSYLTSIPYGKELSQTNESVSDYSLTSASLATDLVAYWSFNEETLNTLPGSYDFEDKSINTNNLSEGGVVKNNQEGILGKGILLDGVNDFLVAPDHSTLDLTTSVTLSAWIKSKGELADSGVYGGIVGKTNFSGSPTYALRVYNSSYEFIVRQSDATFKRSVKNFTPKIVDGKWHHIVGVADAGSGEVKVYIDGVLQTDSIDSTFDGTLAVNTQNLNIGRDYDDSYFNGSIDEVGIWGRALSAAEVLELYRRASNKVDFQVRSCDDSACSGDDWIGPDGTGLTSFSELQNNSVINASGVATGNSLSSSPNFSFSDFVTAPSNNQFFQYRLKMSSLDNSSCNSKTCLPEVSTVELLPTGRYFGGSPTIVTNSLNYNKIKSIEISEVGSCQIRYQLSKDNINFYFWDGSDWSIASLVTDYSDKISVSQNIQKYSQKLGSGKLYVKGFLISDTTQDCKINSILFTNEK